MLHESFIYHFLIHRSFCLTDLVTAWFQLYLQTEEPEATSRSKRKQQQTMRMPNNIHAILNNSSDSSPVRAGSFHTTTNSCKDIDLSHF